MMRLESEIDLKLDLNLKNQEIQLDLNVKK